MKIVNAITKEIIEVENTHQNIIDAIKLVNKYAPKPFEISEFQNLICINETNICIDAIREIWQGDGWVRIEMPLGTSVTLFEFGKIRTFIF
jgi:hypothetical protein